MEPYYHAIAAQLGSMSICRSGIIQLVGARRPALPRYRDGGVSLNTPHKQLVDIALDVSTSISFTNLQLIYFPVFSLGCFAIYDYPSASRAAL
jgi:hypothetical protein